MWYVYFIEDVANEPTEGYSNVVLTPNKDGENLMGSQDMPFSP